MLPYKTSLAREPAMLYDTHCCRCCGALWRPLVAGTVASPVPPHFELPTTPCRSTSLIEPLAEKRPCCHCAASQPVPSCLLYLWPPCLIRWQGGLLPALPCARVRRGTVLYPSALPTLVNSAPPPFLHVVLPTPPARLRFLLCTHCFPAPPALYHLPPCGTPRL